MPWGDWQFWLVTLAAAGGLWLVVRQLRPAKKRRQVRTGLTVSAPRKK